MVQVLGWDILSAAAPSTGLCLSRRAAHSGIPGITLARAKCAAL
jgi:hypothetical protein